MFGDQSVNIAIQLYGFPKCWWFSKGIPQKNTRNNSGLGIILTLLTHVIM